MEKIIIPDEYYVGFKQVNDNPLLAFLTPNGTDSASKKRISTVDKWAIVQVYNAALGKYEYKESYPSKVLKNELLEGYKIANSVKRTYWGGGNVVWRIEDPRGFEFEISSANFARIVSCTVIDNGVIHGKCILGRGSGENILLPELSEPYQEALKVTKAKKSSTIKEADVPIGSNIVLNDSTSAIYMGKVNVVTNPSTPAETTGKHPYTKLNITQYFAYICDNVIYLRKRIKIISHTTGISVDEVKDKLKYLLDTRTSRYSTIIDVSSESSYNVVTISLDRIDKLCYELSEDCVTEFGYNCKYVTIINDIQYEYYRPYNYQSNKTSYLDEISIEGGVLYKTVERRKNMGWLSAEGLIHKSILKTREEIEKMSFKQLFVNVNGVRYGYV